jgi:superfamily II helicase
MQQMIPVALQGPVKALRLVQDGFVDQNGNKLPITPHGQEVLLQLLGVRPGQEADYSEARRAQTQRTAILNRETAVIRRNFAKAFESGDQAAMREWLAEAQTYDARHPGANVTGSLDQSVQQRARARAMSSAFGLPIGTNVRDLGAMPATRFFQPQGAQ